MQVSVLGIKNKKEFYKEILTDLVSNLVNNIILYKVLDIYWI